MISDLETNIVSVERIMDYTQISQVLHISMFLNIRVDC